MIKASSSHVVTTHLPCSSTAQRTISSLEGSCAVECKIWRCSRSKVDRNRSLISKSYHNGPTFTPCRLVYFNTPPFLHLNLSTLLATPRYRDHATLRTRMLLLVVGTAYAASSEERLPVLAISKFVLVCPVCLCGSSQCKCT